MSKEINIGAGVSFVRSNKRIRKIYPIELLVKNGEYGDPLTKREVKKIIKFLKSNI